jgi:hypothetical protein
MANGPTIEILSPQSTLLGPSKEPRADIIIWDDFWPSPEELRSDALSRSFKYFHSPGGFSFRSAETDPEQVKRAADLILAAVPGELTSARLESRFVAETKQDEKLTREKIWVHYDEWIRIGVLYLCPPKPIGGTDFFRHIATRHCSIHAIKSEDERERVLNDSTRLDAWELIEHVEIRFNRLVLFRPHFFHQAACYFGSSVADARLNQVFTFHRD